ncbi:MAG: thymidylate kinase [Actinobacteria bacterium]|nr:thymidylate kinase [Actinomycetota bacterium]MBI3687419.1 thymidylate kinase [Actinomycetota bacterium]
MLITFEGLPGVGKSTQAALLTSCLRWHGHQVLTLPDLATLEAEPVAAAVIELMVSAADPYLRSGDAITDTLLTAAIRADLVATILDPALTISPPQIIIEDRGINTFQSYALASLQRDHRAPYSAALAWVQTLTAMAGPRPGVALWLRLPVDTAIHRATTRGGPPARPEHRSYLHWVDHAYTTLAQHDPQLLTVDVGDGDPEHVHNAIHQLLIAHTEGAAGVCARLPRPITKSA